MGVAPSSVESFRRALRLRDPGSRVSVSVPGEAGYDRGRLSWQLTVEHRPAVLVHAACSADVAATVRAAAEVGLGVTVMTTGHGSVAPADGNVLLNVSALRGVMLDRATGEVEVEAGAPWSAVLEAAAGTGLVGLCGTVPTIGVVGYTLQGGLGWLSRRHGYAAGSALSAEMVTADGETVMASPTVNPELWWALRGGGGSFGVVTRLRLRLHPIGRVLGGSACFPIEAAERTLLAFRAFAAHQPEWSNAAVMLLQWPDLAAVPAPVRGRRVLLIRAFAAAEEATARETMAELWSAAGRPLLDGQRHTGFAEMIARQGPPPAPSASLERMDLFDRLDDPVLSAILDAAGPGAEETVTCVELRQWGGALGHDPGDQAIAHPTTAFSMITAARFDKRRPDEEVRAAVDGLMAASVVPHGNGETLLNLLPDADATATAFSAETFARLRAVKHDWDPHDRMRPGHRIPPISSSGATP